MDTFLGIDIGTGSSKGVVVNPEGKVLATSSISHSTETPFPGAYEHHADKVWWNDVVSISRDVVKQLYEIGLSEKDISAVCVSSIAPCVLPVDKEGKPLRNGILYGIDTRAQEQIARIEEMISEEAIFELSGQKLSSQSCVPKILWIKEHEPEVFHKTSKFLTSTGYVTFRLTGSYTVDIYDGIGYAPLYDLVNHKWDTTYESELFPTSLLPDLMWSSEVCGSIHKEAAAETHLAIGTPVVVGTADAASEALACGVASAGDMMMMYGSSNFFIMPTTSLQPTKKFWASHSLQKGSTVLTGGMATIGNLFKWLNTTFPGRTFDQWQQLSSDVPPGAHGLTILPYFAGERTPLFDSKAKGAMFGLTLQSSAGDIYSAFMESVGYGIRHNLEELSTLGNSVNRIVAIGGAAQDKQLMQRVTDIIGCPQQIPENTLGACYGDAFLAALGVGYFSDISDISRWVHIAHEYVPQKEHKIVYDEGFKKFRNLYEFTKSLN